MNDFIPEKVKEIFLSEKGQALTEYVLVASIIGIALVGVVAFMKFPIANYMQDLLQEIVKTR